MCITVFRQNKKFFKLRPRMRICFVAVAILTTCLIDYHVLRYAVWSQMSMYTTGTVTMCSTYVSNRTRSKYVIVDSNAIIIKEIIEKNVVRSEFESDLGNFFQQNGLKRIDYRKVTYNSRYSPKVCKSKLVDEPPLLLMIISDVRKPERRNIMRELMNEALTTAAVKYSLVFVVGLLTEEQNSNDKNLPVFQEAEKYEDMLIVNILEDYEHLTEKDVCWMWWLNETCRTYKYALKIDADSFIDIIDYVKLIEGCFDSSNRSEICSKICCNYWTSPPPPRSGKYALKVKDYPLSKLPSMCQGVAYLIPATMIGKLLESSQCVPYIRLEDAYVTGFLRSYIGAEIHPLNAYYSEFLTLNEIPKGKLIFHAHSNADKRNISIAEIYQIYQKVLKSTRN